MSPLEFWEASEIDLFRNLNVVESVVRSTSARFAMDAMREKSSTVTPVLLLKCSISAAASMDLLIRAAAASPQAVVSAAAAPTAAFEADAKPSRFLTAD